MKRAIWTTSPRAVDPLSWYTRPLVPLGLALLELVVGFGVVLYHWDQLAHPIIELADVVVMALACVWVQVRTLGLSRRFGLSDTIIALGIGLTGFTSSTWGALDSSLHIQYWWAPDGLAIVIGALVPYSSLRRLLAAGVVGLVASAASALVAFPKEDAIWSTVSTVVIGCLPVLIAVGAGASFSAHIVGRTLAQLEIIERRADDADVRREALDVVERRTVARLGVRVSPFLEHLASRGTVTEEDRAVAGQLARQLRDDLVERTDHDWLTSLADVGRVYVVDPERRAARLGPSQRMALRGLITTVLTNPSTDQGSLFVEIRGRDDDSTAVALSFDMDLPEGRRSLLIAPFYLALESSTTNLRWDRARGVVSFDVE